jgi:predicted mannosyl-3-phosphoglycerate phosphatase (HAD superfamily)
LKQAFIIQIRRGLSWEAGTSTTFFNVTIDDLLTQLDKGKNVKAVFFVDDTVLWTPLPKCQEYQLLQIRNEALTTLSDWYKDNAMTINTRKTFYQNFTLRHYQPTIKSITNHLHKHMLQNT